MWAFVSEDLLGEILKKLPTKTLIRLLCVCKAWKTLISSTLFIKLHNSSTRSATPPTSKSYLLVRGNHPLRRRFRQESVTSGKHLKRNVHCPFQFAPAIDFTLVGVVRGVVCLSYSTSSPFDSNILWNPVFHTYITLPRLPFPLYSYGAIGLGYDGSKNGGFKVVRISTPNIRVEVESQQSYAPTYEVHTALEGGAWRVAMADNLRHFELIQGISRTGSFVDGSIHWLARTQKEGDRGLVYSMLRFDCESEELMTMDLPQVIFPKPPMKSKVMEYGGMLSIVALYDDEYYDEYLGRHRDRRVEVWVMKEYGVATSWHKLYRRSAFGIFESLIGEVAPYGPRQWDRCRGYTKRYNRIVSEHVYEESMFLMDHPKAKSYSHKETVRLCSSHF